MGDDPNIGTLWLGWNGETYICADHTRYGYTMVNESDPNDERCISERALGRTFHRLPASQPSTGGNDRE
jgi:hypothetical protein